MTRYFFRLISATVFIAAASVVLCPSASAHEGSGKAGAWPIMAASWAKNGVGTGVSTGWAKGEMTEKKAVGTEMTRAWPIMAASWAKNGAGTGVSTGWAKGEMTKGKAIGAEVMKIWLHRMADTVGSKAITDTVPTPDPQLVRAADSIKRAQDSVRKAGDSSSRARTGRMGTMGMGMDTVKTALDSLKFPLFDRRGDPISNPNRNPFDLKDPSNIRDSIEYDPLTQQYYIVEKIGDHYYRKPTYLTFDELMQMQGKASEDDYFRQRADALDALNRKLLRPKLAVGDNLFNRIFGNGKIDIRPQGNVDITAGYAGQNIQNPTLPESARKTGGFDFNESANINVIGNIGNKLKLPISYNTLANFDFENQLKLDYTGGPDEIIKKIEAGNVAFTTKSTPIQGAQSLFGIKTQLQSRQAVHHRRAGQSAFAKTIGLLTRRGSHHVFSVQGG